MVRQHSKNVVLLVTACLICLLTLRAQQTLPAREANLQEGGTPVEVAPTPSVEEIEPIYRLGVNDIVTISVLGLEEIHEHKTQIGTTGTIDLLLVGRVHAAGLTVEELRGRITERLGHYMKDPQVTVSIGEFRSQPVSVIGAVKNPGVHQVEGRKTLVEVLSLAGGLRDDAGYVVKITRRLDEGRIPLPNAQDDPTGRFSIAEEDLPAVMEARTPENNIAIRSHDVISVPLAKMVYVVGGVKRAGAFAFGERESISVLQVVSLANGLDREASPGSAKILRAGLDADAKTEVPVNLKRILSGQDPDISLKPNDILFVPDSKMKTITKAALDNIVRFGTSVLIWRIR
jgi:polysaccharide export outer membrane protein